jgi:Na+/melibiose symporter-like transporter
MFVAWAAIGIAVILTAAVCYALNRRMSARLEKEIARLKAQLEREQEFSNQLISLMPQDEEEPK